MPLLSLPAEIHLKILSYLDLPSLVKIAATNRYFNTLPTSKLLREAMLAYEEITHHAIDGDVSWDCILWADFVVVVKHPCYGCLRMLSTDAFFKIRGNHGWEDLNVDGITLDYDLRKERRCLTCDADTGGKFKEAMKSRLRRKYEKVYFDDPLGTGAILYASFEIW